MTNPEGLGEDEFREKFPTAGAAYLLDPDCAGLPGILAQAAAPGEDPLAEARRELRRYLLGPDKPDALTRFTEAIEALAGQVARRTGGASGRGSWAPAWAPLLRADGRKANPRRLPAAAQEWTSDL